jgi:hypothetical protein
LAQVLVQLYMNSKNLRRRKIERFTLADLACSKRRNAGTPECRNTGMPEHRNAGTPEYHFHFEGKL